MDTKEVPSKRKKENNLSFIKCIICQMDAKKKV